MHIVAAAALIATDLPIPAIVSFWIALGLSLRAFARMLGPTALTLRADGELEMHFPGGDAVMGRVRSATTVLPWMVVLLVRTGKHTRAITLPVDATAAQGHRRLRLWLRWQASPVV
jgi:hypothetical protein